MNPDNTDKKSCAGSPGDIRELAKLISKIENDRHGCQQILSDIYKENLGTTVIGVTGPPGSGKSSLTDRLIKEYRVLGKRVGVIAVDPSSPFSGGAILGDRIRMSDHATDPDVFIRSMASRGSLGGLAPAAIDVVNLMKSTGFDVVIIETVGVGQSEVDVVSLADTVLLVLVPGMGDDVQAMKAGIMEIADIFVVNKADKDGKEKLVAELKMIVELNRNKMERVPPIIETVAIENKGTSLIMESLKERGSWIDEKLPVIRKKKMLDQLKHMSIDRIGADIFAILDEKGIFQKWTQELDQGSSNPYKAVSELIAKLKIEWSGQ